jgi:ABC-2 type transport system ATP-binding protein
MVIEITDLTICGAPSKLDWLKQHLSARWSINPALQRLTGNFFCGVNLILGPNGAGKSLLMRILAGLIRPRQGVIMIDGRVADPSLLRQNCGYLPQTFGFYPQYSAREMLRYIALLKGIVDRVVVEEQVEKVLQRTDLLAVAERKIGEYSRGMRQKVGIAQALLGDPPVLLLDDPTAGLDPESRNSFRGMMVELGWSRVVIWASSLVTDAGCADRVLILDRSERRFWGTPVELVAGTRLPAPASRGSKGETDDETWFDLLERGYRIVLADREDRCNNYGG